MFRRVARGMFPLSNCRGPISTSQASGGRPVMLFHRWPEGEVVPPLFFYGFCFLALHALCVQLLDRAGLFSAVGFCLSNSGSTADFHLCNNRGTVGFCFPNESGVVGLSLSDGRATMVLCLPNSLSGLCLVLMKGHLKIQNSFPLMSI